MIRATTNYKLPLFLLNPLIILSSSPPSSAPIPSHPTPHPPLPNPPRKPTLAVKRKEKPRPPTVSPTAEI